MALTTIRYYDNIIPETSGTLNIGSSSSFIATVTAQDFNSISDLSLKDNIEILEDSLGIIKQLNGYSFNWKDTNQKSIGVIAQEVEAILPELISTSDDGIKSVSYIALIPVLIEAIKELSDKIDNT